MKSPKKKPTLSKDDIENMFMQLFKDDPPPKIGYVGDGWYQLGDNCHTNRAGYEEFLKILKEQINETKEE